MAGLRDGYPTRMSENTEQPGTTEPEGYDPSTDTDADPEMMNPRDLTGDESGETDPDVDPDSMNPRGEA